MAGSVRAVALVHSFAARCVANDGRGQHNGWSQDARSVSTLAAMCLYSVLQGSKVMSALSVLHYGRLQSLGFG
jgi:hypothetical protein